MIPIRDSIPCYSVPVVTWALMTINILVFLAMLLMPAIDKASFTYLYGMVTARYSHPEWAIHMGFPNDHYLSFVTSMFLHSGWLHISFNMLFMWIFADNIEDRMGRIRFIIFYFLCGLIAAVAQYFINPESVLPVVGSSGAIAGVMSAYLFLYPFARVVIWVPLFFLPIFFEIPAIAFLGFWIIIQMQYVTETLITGQTAANVAWGEHLGGFLAGILLYRLFIRDVSPLDQKDE
jgi:rhomboid family protein